MARPTQPGKAGAKTKRDAIEAKFKQDMRTGKAKPLSGEIISPSKLAVKLATTAAKTIKGLTKVERIARDKALIAKSPDLKNTPNLTLGQAKAMKQGTKQLAKTTKSIAKKADKTYGKTTIGDANAFKVKMGLDKPVGGTTVPRMPALSTPGLGGLHKGPSNMTLGQMDKLQAIADAQKAKAYAAKLRQMKRDGKSMKKDAKKSIKDMTK